MKFKSQVYTQASGSIGGVTYSRNRGGMYTRSRAIPVNPNSERQGEARANMAQAVGYWTNTLTDTQRQGWTSYAEATPLVDVLGDQLILSGQQMFIRCVLPRLVAGLLIVADAPTTAGLATTPLFTSDPELDSSSGISSGSVEVPAAGVTGDLNIYLSVPTPQSRTVAHAKRAWAVVKGPPVADEFALTTALNLLPYALPTGLQCRVTVVYLGDDGRVSAEAFRDVVIVA